MLQARYAAAAIAAFTAVAALTLMRAPADPVAGARVIDGDTLALTDGRHVRLVGFDAPEFGNHARCPAEAELAQRSKERLRFMLDNATRVKLELVGCSCQPETEGTRLCNYGRACGHLSVDGRDAGAALIAEGLARPYVCGPVSCPRRGDWCR
jgi:micrococcal nuclease